MLDSIINEIDNAISTKTYTSIGFCGRLVPCYLVKGKLLAFGGLIHKTSGVEYVAKFKYRTILKSRLHIVYQSFMWLDTGSNPYHYNNVDYDVLLYVIRKKSIVATDYFTSRVYWKDLVGRAESILCSELYTYLYEQETDSIFRISSTTIEDDLKEYLPGSKVRMILSLNRITNLSY